MAISILDVIKEQTRQQSTGDTEFYKVKSYLFKLVTVGGKGPTGPTGEAYFPLPINPEELHYRLPFAAVITPTQDGGTVTEEGGIVIGNLRIQGTMGFNLKKSRDTTVTSGNPKWTGQIPTKYAGSMNEMSGQMLLWRLIGRCFDAYSELKKDPMVAHKTHMEFHNLKDQISLKIVPKEVSITKNKSPYRLMMQYTIECDVIGPADAPNAAALSILGDGKEVLDYLSDAIAFLRNGVSLLKGTIDDMSACISDLKRYVTNAVAILDDIKSVHDSVSDFVSGVTSYVDLPATFLSALTGTVESAFTVANTATGIPEKAARSYSECSDILDRLAAGAKGKYREQLDDRVKKINDSLAFANVTSSEQALIDTSQIKAASAAGSMSASQAFGGAYSAGDKTRQNISKAVPDLIVGEYNGFSEGKIEQGDTINSLATKYMGDPHKWSTIAILNNLKPPYITGGVRAPNTLTVGNRFVFPVRANNLPQSSSTTGNPVQGSSQAADVMGTDFRWEKLANGKWSWMIDVAHGSDDLQTVTDIPNLTQGLEVMFRTEQGTNPLFPGLGIVESVGTDNRDQAAAEGKMSIQQQITSDPRIERLLGLTFDVDGDVLTIVVDAQPVTFDSSRTIPVTLY